MLQEEEEWKVKREAAKKRAAEEAARPKAVPADERYIPRPATPPPQELSPQRSLTPSPSPTKVIQPPKDLLCGRP